MKITEEQVKEVLAIKALNDLRNRIIMDELLKDEYYRNLLLKLIKTK
jgi:hypothetical protein